MLTPLIEHYHKIRVIYDASHGCLKSQESRRIVVRSVRKTIAPPPPLFTTPIAKAQCWYARKEIGPTRSNTPASTTVLVDGDKKFRPECVGIDKRVWAEEPIGRKGGSLTIYKYQNKYK